jgi:hypothetical protein
MPIPGKAGGKSGAAVFAGFSRRITDSSQLTADIEEFLPPLSANRVAIELAFKGENASKSPIRCANRAAPIRGFQCRAYDKSG